MTQRVRRRTLARIDSFYRRKAEWIGLLRRNASAKLNRLAGIVEIKPSSLNPRQPNQLVLVYTGIKVSSDVVKDYARIERVLGATFDTNHKAVVQFGRITLNVTLTTKCVTLQKAA